MRVEPLTISIPDDVLDDLHVRLAETRWPDEVAGAGWDYGVPLDYLRELCDDWRGRFDWRSEERRLNGFANSIADVDGHPIHFVHTRGRRPNSLPLILTHGWPSSFYELLDLVPLLTDPGSHGGDPDDAFDVVVPSVPGYGFSGRPTHRGFSYVQVADLWAKLMDGLGYDQFGAHAYDIGASITGLVLRRHPGRIIGYHTTEPTNPAAYLGVGEPELTPAESEYLELADRWEQDEGGYMAVQTTRPQTLGYGLNDSPAGMAAWIIEKWHNWTIQPGGTLDAHFTRQQLLTNLTIYWATETLNSANRLYYERAHHSTPLAPGERIAVPVGVARTTQPIERAPRELVERVFPDIRHWIDLPRGGHFVALEEPGLVASSIREFFRPMRQTMGDRP